MKNYDDEETHVVMTPTGYEEVHMYNCDAKTVEVPVHVVWALKRAEAEELAADTRPRRKTIRPL
jgi:hypothetical protein